MQIMQLHFMTTRYKYIPTVTVIESSLVRYSTNGGHTRPEPHAIFCPPSNFVPWDKNQQYEQDESYPG